VHTLGTGPNNSQPPWCHSSKNNQSTVADNTYTPLQLHTTATQYFSVNLYGCTYSGIVDWDCLEIVIKVMSPALIRLQLVHLEQVVCKYIDLMWQQHLNKIISRVKTHNRHRLLPQQWLLILPISVQPERPISTELLQVRLSPHKVNF